MMRRSGRDRARGAWLVAALALTVVVSAMAGGPGLGSRGGASVAPAARTGSAPAASGNDYPTYLGSDERTSAVTNAATYNLTSVPRVATLWNVTVRAGVSSQAVESGGVVYFGANNGYEYAVGALNGSLLWRTFLGTDQNDTGCLPGSLGITSTGTVSGPNLFVDGGYPFFYALNATTGAIEWRVPLGGSNNAGFYDWSSPLLYDQNAYVGLSSWCDTPLVPAGLVEISLKTHAQVAYFNTSVPEPNGSSIWGSPSVNPATNTIFFTTGNAYLTTTSVYSESIVALNASTLAFEDSWQVPEADAPGDSDFGVTPTVFTTPAGVSMVTAANKNGFLYAFYQSNLSLAWDQRVCCQMGQDDHYSTAFGDGYVFAVGALSSIGGQTYDSSVHAFYPQNGTPVWKVGFPESPYNGYAAPLYVNGVLIVADGPDLLFLNPRTGGLVKEIHVGGVIRAAATLARGELYVGSTNGYLLALDVTLNTTASQSVTTGLVPLVVNFSANGTGGVPPYSYLWSFGDGTTSTAQFPPHDYTTPGAYEVEVTVTDTAGANVTHRLTVTVKVPLTKSGLTPTEEALAGLVVVLVVLGVVALYIVQRRRHTRQSAGDGRDSPAPTGGAASPAPEAPVDGGAGPPPD
jgi:outer membrane protein assembly factor BamB